MINYLASGVSWVAVCSDRTERLKMEPKLTKTYREGHELRKFGCVDFDFGSSILCLVFLRLMENKKN